MEHLVSNELNYYNQFCLDIFFCTVTKLSSHAILFFRSDIQYSIDDDTESLHKDADPESRTPIIKPSSRQLSNNSDLKGSENSLLNMTDEDLWLRKGMDEDGSFRQVYIKE